MEAGLYCLVFTVPFFISPHQDCRLSVTIPCISLTYSPAMPGKQSWTVFTYNGWNCKCMDIWCSWNGGNQALMTDESNIVFLHINLLVTRCANKFNIQQLYVLPTLYLCVVYLRTNSNLCHVQHKLVGFYNWDEKCLEHGMDWVFK
jgi:hypothetical protein